MPRIAAISFAVPPGKTPKIGFLSDFIIPFTTSLMVPSPPATKKHQMMMHGQKHTSLNL